MTTHAINRIVEAARPVSTRTKALERRLARLHTVRVHLSPQELASDRGRALFAELGKVESAIMARRSVAAIRAAGIRGVREIPADAMREVLVPEVGPLPAEVARWCGDTCAESVTVEHDGDDVPDWLRGRLVADNVDAEPPLVLWRCGMRWTGAQADRLPPVPPQLLERQRRAAEAVQSARPYVAGRYLVRPVFWCGPRARCDVLAVLRVQWWAFETLADAWLLVGRCRLG